MIRLTNRGPTINLLTFMSKLLFTLRICLWNLTFKMDKLFENGHRLLLR